MSRYGERTRINEAISGFGRKPSAGIGYGIATGGTSNARTVGGIAYTVLTFSSDDNLVVSTAGLFDILVIAGGGGGGGVNASASNTSTGGGGGAGAVIGFAETTTVYLEVDTYVVDIGAGGAGGSLKGNQGLASSIESVISAAGGGRGAGASNTATSFENASVGGSGGGSNSNSVVSYSVSVPSITPLFGKSGGVSNAITAGGGGGGFTTAGGNGVSTTGGAGGNGVDVAGFGTVASGTDFVAAGGGGGGATAGAAGTGGVAGATGGTASAATTAGSGGGGSRGPDGIGGAGAAGKVFVRFKV